MHSTTTECLDPGVIVMQLNEVGVPESLMPKHSLEIPRKMTMSFFPRSVTRRDLCPLAKPAFSASGFRVDL